MPLNFSKHSPRNGFSLLELLLSIGIISLIILMATRYFTSARNAQLVSAAVQQIQGIRASASTMLAQGVPFATASTPGVSIKLICDSGGLPNGYCDTSGALITPWTVGTTGDSTNEVKAPPASTNDIFTLSYAFPTPQACNATMNSFTRDLDLTNANSSCATTVTDGIYLGKFSFLQ